MDFYGVVSQLIATLFIAIAVELFAREKPMWEDAFDQWMVLGLISMSWGGLFACIRAMLDDEGTALTSGVATAGITSASVLVSLALFSRVKSTAGVSTGLMLVFLIPPVLLLIIL